MKKKIVPFIAIILLVCMTTSFENYDGTNVNNKRDETIESNESTTEIIIDFSDKNNSRKIEKIIGKSKNLSNSLEELQLKVATVSEKEKEQFRQAGVLWFEDEEIVHLGVMNRTFISSNNDKKIVAGNSKTNDKMNIKNKDNWAFSYEKIPEIWKQGYTGAGIKIAILDTGIDATHEDLRIKGGISYVNGPYDEDINGHGTHVAGIIAAKDNAIGVRGVAKDAEIYSVRVLKDDGNGKLSTILSGINWAIKNKMDIISMSLGSKGNFTILNSAINKAYESGIPIITAGGNTGKDAENKLNYPANYFPTIAVGSIGLHSLSELKSGIRISDFSSSGREIDVVASGEDILSTVPGGYGEYSGTSMAAPYVTGVVALLLQKNEMSVYELTKVIRDSAVDLGKTGPDDYYGYGMINLARAFELINEGTISSIKGITQKDDMKGPKDSVSLDEIIPIPNDEKEKSVSDIEKKKANFYVKSTKDSKNVITGTSRSITLQILRGDNKKGIQGAIVNVSLIDPDGKAVANYSTRSSKNGTVQLHFSKLKKSGMYQVKYNVEAGNMGANYYKLSFSQVIPKPKK